MSRLLSEEKDITRAVPPAEVKKLLAAIAPDESIDDASAEILSKLAQSMVVDTTRAASDLVMFQNRKKIEVRDIQKILKSDWHLDLSAFRLEEQPGGQSADAG